MARVLAGVVVLAAVVAARQLGPWSTTDTPRESPFLVSEAPAELGNYHGYNSTIFCADNVTTAYDDASGRWRRYLVFAGGDRQPYVTVQTPPLGPWEEPVNVRPVLGSRDMEPDAHNCLVAAVDPEGYVHLAGNVHVDPLSMARSVRPHDISEFRPVAEMVDARAERAVTYPTFVKTADGDLLFAYRDGRPGRTGRWILNRWDPTTGDPGRWVRVAVLTGASGESFYPHHIAVDRSDRATHGRIHVFGTWRVERSATYESNEDLLHFYSDDEGETWYQYGSDDRLATPITFERGERVLDTEQEPDSRFIVNQGGLEVDARGRPHALVKMSTSAGEERSRLHHVWYTGSRWVIEPLEELGERSRSSVLTDRSGNVYGFVSPDSQSGTMHLIDLTPGSPTYATRIAEVARRVESRRMSAVFDTRALYERDELAFLIAPSADASVAHDDHDHPAWRQRAYVVTVPLDWLPRVLDGDLAPVDARLLRARSEAAETRAGQASGPR